VSPAVLKLMHDRKNRGAVVRMATPAPKWKNIRQWLRGEQFFKRKGNVYMLPYV